MNPLIEKYRHKCYSLVLDSKTKPLYNIGDIVSIIYESHKEYYIIIEHWVEKWYSNPNIHMYLIVSLKNFEYYSIDESGLNKGIITIKE